MPDLKIAGRSAGPAILACLAVLGLLSAPASADAGAAPEGRVTIVVLPQGTTPDDLTGMPGAAIGLMNPGLGDVSAEQTWLDVSQGARSFDSSYDTALDTLLPSGGSTVGWEEAVDRAAGAGSDLIPGLLATALARHGIRATAAESAGAAALAVARRNGRIGRPPAACGTAAGSATATAGCSDPVTVLSMTLADALELARSRHAGETMIFVESPPAGSGDQLAIAIAGPGFDGMLQSPSTRTDGYVLSTDLAPTVLAHFGIDAPKAMTGLPIESGGKVDLDGLSSLEGRYEQVGKRRGAALAIPLLLWIGLTALVSLLSRGAYARPALRLLCLSTVLLPAALLLTAALSPSLALERAIATLLPVLIAAALTRLLPGPASLAVACGLTVVPYGVDMLAGSVLTPRAVIGPNPGLGARFYGIGNELESTLMILTSVGTGAAVTWFRSGARRSAAAFLAVGLVTTIVFAAGRFGADVGAAIVFPVAAVVAAALAIGRPRLAWAGLAAAAGALALVALADIATGSETHYVRSIVGGSGGSILDVLSHRLDATVESFTRVSRVPVTVAALIAIGLGTWKRDRLRAWIDPFPLLGAGIWAAAAGSVVGALTNDSGALFIQVGALYLALLLGFTWAMGSNSEDSG